MHTQPPAPEPTLGSQNAAQAVQTRLASIEDLEPLLHIENTCFSSDRLSRRSLKHHIQSVHSVLLVAERAQPSSENTVLGYALCLLNRGTRLARLYSLAVLPSARGLSLGRTLVEAIEREAAERDRLHMRLEVAKSNLQAIALYQSLDYRQFGEYPRYYEDQQDAIRMQKTIRQPPSNVQQLRANWYQQTTDFTCGPAALMMAMAMQLPELCCNQALEIALWRESTTVFMTSGLGGTHPFGLALAANKRGFQAEVFVNTDQALFIEGVRTEKKKVIMSLVHQQFFNECQAEQIPIHQRVVSQDLIERWIKQGLAIIMLISTYKLDGKKAPHWVLITGIDSDCLYVHDPDLDDKWQRPLDCQHIPISRADFEKMSTFGASRLRCALTLKAR